MAGFDTRNALNLAIRHLSKVALERAAGGWIPPKEEERRFKEQTRAEEKHRRETERHGKEQNKLLSKQFPTQYMPNVGRQVMNTGGTPDQPQRQLSPMGFYSAAAERASTLQPSGDAVQMVNALKNTQGIKTEELQNAGMIDESGNVHPDWAGRGKVTREDLVSHLQGQMPQVEETVLGGETPRIKELKNQMSQMAENDPRYFNLEQELLFEQTNSGTKYSQYTLPGGENYREVLLRLKPEMRDLTMDEVNAARQKISPMLRPLTEEEYAKELSKGNIVKVKKNPNAPIFQSSHFPDPDILAHIRMADRTGPNGEKILHVEELQSDWGQKGKKEGFLTDEMKIQAKNARENYNNYKEDLKSRYADSLIDPSSSIPVEKQKELIKPILNQTYLEDMAKKMGEYDKLYNLNLEAEDFESGLRGLPSAPYVTSTEGWTDLALKRVLKEAAEGGYDKVVWTPGEEQAARYDLSKQISKLTYLAPDSKFGDKFGTNLRAYDHEGNVVINKTVPPKELENYVGKEVAQKLIDQEADRWGKKELSGLDLSVGGEGMKGYYDSIVPKRLQNLAKKYDKNAKLGYTETHHRGQVSNAPMSYTLPSLDITPAMRESILRGQSAYQRGGTVSKKHPALSIAGTHIREEEHGEPIFAGRL